MKKIFVAIVCLIAARFTLTGQTTENFLQRYDLLVSRVGPSGIGVDNLLNNWYKADSTDINVLLARFNYFYSASRRDSVVCRYSKKYLGMAPILSLKDTLGRTTYYYSESFFNEQTFGNAIKWLDRALVLHNSRLDLCFMKADALLSYEKASPDMTLDYLKSVVEANFTRKSTWDYPGADVDAEFFNGALQQYCYTFFQIGTTQSMEAFKSLSELMLKYQPKDVNFINNIGAYYTAVKDNDKQALKYFRKSLKINPSDSVAIKNVQRIEKRSSSLARKK